MLWYIARVWLASKFGTRTVIAGVMIGPTQWGREAGENSL